MIKISINNAICNLFMNKMNIYTIENDKNINKEKYLTINFNDNLN